MQRARSHSASPTLGRPVAPKPVSASIPDVNQLGIRIHGLKSIPLWNGARLTAFLACAGELRRMPKQFLPLLAEELVSTCATLPFRQQIPALEAVFSFQKSPACDLRRLG
jgi:hypothetical protein